MSRAAISESHELPTPSSKCTSTIDPEQSITHDGPKLSRSKSTATIVSVGCSTFLSAIINGMFTVEIPTIAHDVHLSQKLLLWPQSIVSLVSACTLLLSGSISDTLGSKSIYLAGSFLQCGFILGAGLAQTASQILVFRGFMGVAQSMLLTSSVSIIMSSFPAGRRRNIAFASMGGGQPLGFSLGLVLAGIFTQDVNWRFGMYLVAGINAAVLVLAAFGIQNGKKFSSRGVCWQLRVEIDWVGAFIASISLALLCYVLA